MPVNNTSWADRIGAAQTSAKKFEPIPVGRYNFTIEDDPEVKPGPKGDFINYRAKIMAGQERANGLVFERTFPYASNPVVFLELFNAMGYANDWLLQSDPSAQQIAEALKNRPFSAEVVEDTEGNVDRNGDLYRKLKNYRPVAAAGEVAQAPPATQPAAGSSWGAEASVTPPPAAPTPDQVQPPASGSPWGSLATPPANPFGN